MSRALFSLLAPAWLVTPACTATHEAAREDAGLHGSQLDSGPNPEHGDAATEQPDSGVATIDPFVVLEPRLLARENENALDGQGFRFLVNGSGLSERVPTGDLLETAQAAVHVHRNTYMASYATVDSGPDYFQGFGRENPPAAIWDLGQELPLQGIVLWQYENDGGGASYAEGNAARTIALYFNAEAQGADVFEGAPLTITMKPVGDGDAFTENDMGGINAAQTFSFHAAARYVRMVITDNYRGFQRITYGGDRVGLGELRFIVPASALTAP